MPGAACYERIVNALWAPDGTELGSLLRLVWSDTTDPKTWMGRRPNGESFTSDSQTDVYRWLTNPPVATLSTEPEKPEPVLTMVPQPTTPRRRK